MHVLPIASGKGGVGKSLLAANIAIVLAQAGKRVILADLDLGGSNLHLILGLRNITSGIGTIIGHAKADFDEIIVTTEYDGLRFIPGDAEIPGIANISSAQKRTLIRKLMSLDADYLILDLGAGTNFNILDFFLVSGNGIIVTTPTPTATVNAYLFLKNVVFRIMNTAFKRNSEAAKYLDSLKKEGTQLQRVYIMQLLEHIRSIDPASHAAFEGAMSRFHPRLVLNMMEDPKDADKATRFRRSCRQYLGLDVEHLGIIYRDEIQDIALQSRLPVVIYKPAAVLSLAVYRIADKLLQLGEDADGSLGLETIDESYETAEMEAEIDFEAKMDYVEDLLHTGALTQGDLVEAVKTQQYEINQLRRENQLLKSKLLKAAGQGFHL
jgi:flagellar biosynthesis protein FlhG